MNKANIGFRRGHSGLYVDTWVIARVLVLMAGVVFFLLGNLFLSPVSADKTGVCGAPGKDGPPASLSGVVNSYYPGSAGVTAGATAIPVGSPRSGGGPAIAAGDLLLVVQVQGADINAANSNYYGNDDGDGDTDVDTIPYSDTLDNYAGGHVSNGNFTAGNYEYVVAAGPVSGGFVSITSGLVNSYTQANYGTQGQRRFQVIRVPQYSNATLTGELTSLRWNGSTGGFVVLDVTGQLNWNGRTINVNGMGFRGGGGDDLGGSGGLNWWDFRTSASLNANGSKGEGTAGTPRYVNDNNTLVDTGIEGYPNGSRGRGAPGNAGGGGTDGNPSANDQNSGGGGGGNGGYGGMGGNSWSSQRVNGGYGGAPFPGSAARVVLGGGGGAGTTNNGTGTPGGGFASSGAAGGGVVFVRAGTITGTGTINANGAAANNTVENDGGGGGGAGGSVVVIAQNGAGSVGVLTVNASGGRGGDAWRSQNGNDNRHGPGGGGGGGQVYTSGTLAASNVAGGANGYTTSRNNPPQSYGATGGGQGSVSPVSLASVPTAISGANCVPVTPSVSKTTSTPSIARLSTGATGTYTIRVSVPSTGGWATGVQISDTLPTPTTGTITYASTVSINTSDPAVVTNRTDSSDPAAGTTTPTWGTWNIAPGGYVEITFNVSFSSTVPLGTYQNPAVSPYLDPVRTVNTGTLNVAYASGSSTGEDILVTNATAVTLYDFIASNAHPGVRLNWSTATEVNNLGFNLYRRPLVGGEFVKINPYLIVSQAPGQLMGADYTWLDETAGAGDAYLYRLDALDVDGSIQEFLTTYQPEVPPTQEEKPFRSLLPIIYCSP